MSQYRSVNPSRFILLAGFVLGIIVSWSLISGDSQGRVNLLHLVFVYVFLPIITLLISGISQLLGQEFNFAVLVSKLPLWSESYKRKLLLKSRKKNSRLYFFQQSQIASLSFSFSSLLVFLILLLSTDVNFVWRSTLLDAEGIYPVLKLLAAPWLFWDAAQPNLELLKMTQNSRIASSTVGVGHFGDWWQFIVAAQIFYAFLLRLITLSVSSVILTIRQNSRTLRQNHAGISKAKKQEKDIKLANVVKNINSDYALTNWCGLDSSLLQQVESHLDYKRINELFAGPLVSHSEQMVAERWQDNQLLIVKGWEPPLAELADFMQNGKGTLLPLDWNEKGLNKLASQHLQEWQRFVSTLDRWKLLQLEQL